MGAEARGDEAEQVVGCSHSARLEKKGEKVSQFHEEPGLTQQ